MPPHKYSGKRVDEILRLKKASVRNAPLPPGSPSWTVVESMLWEDVDDAAKADGTGFKTIRKLLTDSQFDR